MPLLTISAEAVGDSRNLISALPASGSFEPVAMPAENTVIFCSGSGRGPGSSPTSITARTIVADVVETTTELATAVADGDLTREVKQLRRDLAEEIRRGEQRDQAENKAQAFYNLIRQRDYVKVVEGYESSNIYLAIERREIDGRCGFGWPGLKATKPDWIRDKKINVLLQLAMRKHPELSEVPLIIDLVTKDDDLRALVASEWWRS